MLITRLQVNDLRCLEGLDLTLGPGLHVFVGANGAGKTSILEAASLLGSGKSFRPGGAEVLIRRGAKQFSVIADLESAGQAQRVGYERGLKHWRARVAGVELKQLAPLARCVPIWVAEPGSHALILGGSEERRRLYDWLLFHVEPSFARAWTQFRSVLKQRNSLLKASADEAEIAAWDELFVRMAQPVSQLRSAHALRWAAHVNRAASQLLPELGMSEVEFRSGWKFEESDPERWMERARTALRERRARDLAQGFSTLGAHRADWLLRFEHAPEREHYSRGQSKNVCLAAVFGTMACLRELTGVAPLLCLDDLFSELDEDHQSHCLRFAQQLSDQVLVTGVQSSPAIAAWTGACAVYYLEAGSVTRIERAPV